MEIAKIDTEVSSARSHSLGKFPGYLLLDRPVEALQFLDPIGPESDLSYGGHKEDLC